MAVYGTNCFHSSCDYQLCGDNDYVKLLCSNGDHTVKLEYMSCVAAMHSWLTEFLHR